MTPPKPYPELTWATVLTAIVVGVVLNMGICYSGLKIGFTINGSSVAAVVGFGILRGLFRRGTILEVNITQTVGSCVNVASAGIIFTIPALFIMGRQAEINYSALVLASVAGSILGVVMIIPLRKQIIDYERLRFPEGTAVAAILKSPGQGIRKAQLWVVGILCGAAAAALIIIKTEAGQSLLPEAVNVGAYLGLPAGVRFVFAASALSLGAGYLAGRPGLAVLYGTLLNFWILIPVCLKLGWVPEPFTRLTFQDITYENANAFIQKFSLFTSRHVGIGMLLGGALAGVVVAVPALKAAISSLKSGPASGEREEMPFYILALGMIVGLAMLFTSLRLCGGENVGWGKAAIATLVAGVWLWLSGLVVAQTTGRTNWSPLSGLALIATTLMLGILGTGDAFLIPAVTVGAAACVATSMCADMIADLKTGYLIGARPIRQQIAQMSTCWIGPLVSIATLMILWQHYGFGPHQAKILHDRAVQAGTLAEFTKAGGSEDRLPNGTPPLKAPQADTLATAIQIVQSGDMPLGKYMAGAVIGVLISLLVSPGMGVMVGLSMYLPFEYMVVFGIGCFINMGVRRLRGAQFAEDWGVPLAAGLIVGDSAIGVGNALWQVAGSMWTAA